MQIAIIPARGGSKRIPRKNIRVFGGKPMVAHAIEAAIESGMFEHVIVSTDDEEIANVANEYGAETPFMRPSELSDDHAPIVSVMAHAISATEERGGGQIERACCIFPGVPFIRIEDIEAALRLLEKTGADYSFPIAEFPSAIQRALRRSENGRLAPYFSEHELTRTQDLEPAYHDAGQFYWGSRDAWIAEKSVHSNGVGLVIPYWRVVDIDTPDDWERAERLQQMLQQQ